MTATVKTEYLAIGATAVDMPLHEMDSTGTLISVKNALSGSLTVTAVVIGGSRQNDVTDGVIDLSLKDYIYIPDIPLKSLHLVYSGPGTIDVVAFQLGR